MVIRWRRQTGRWMKIMWLNELSVFSGSNFRPVSRIKYWQSMSLQTARVWTHWHSAQNFSFPVYIAFFFFLWCEFHIGSWRGWWWSYRLRAAMPVTASQEQKHIQKTSVQRLWWRWEDSSWHLSSSVFLSAHRFDVLVISLQGAKLKFLPHNFRHLFNFSTCI